MLAAFVIAIGTSATSQFFVDLGVISGYGTESACFLLSGDGTTAIVQSVYDPPGSSVYFKSFKWTTATGGQSLGFVPTNQGNWTDVGVYGMSSDAQIMVGCAGFIAGAANPRANWIWTPSNGYQLTGPSHIYVAASDDGSVRAGDYSVPYPSRHAVRWTEATGPVYLGTGPGGGDLYTHCDAMTPDGSVIVGTRQTGTSSYEAFRWTQATGMVGIGGRTAEDVSDNGAVVVGNTGTRGFRWSTSGGLITLNGLPPFSHTTADAVSGSGQIIVGHSYHSTTGERATIWDASLTPLELKSVLINNYGLGSQLAGWQLTQAIDISSDGTVIVGNGINPRGCERAWLVRLTPGSPLPSPPPCPDANCSGTIDSADLSVMLTQFSQNITPNTGCDFNADGIVNSADLSILLASFGQPCGW